MSGERGRHFFARLKSQLDVVLQNFRVHYYFFAEVPQKKSSSHDEQAAPEAFGFLNDIFLAHRHDLRASYIKNMDVRRTLFQHMNADMIITTGSSFPLLAATISPKVRS